jgi:tetratricopeptide (TPR) repeat protein
MLLTVSVALAQLDQQGKDLEDLSSLIERWNDVDLAADERLEAVKEIHIAFHQMYPDTVLHYLEEMRELAKSDDRPLVLFSAHNRIASLLEKQGRTTDALIAFGHAEQVAISLGDSARLGSVYGNRGNVYVQLNQYVEAVRHFNRATELYADAGAEDRARSMRMALGNVFMLIDHYTLAMDQFVVLQKEISDEQDMGYFPGLLALNMGWCAFKLKDFDSASALYASALPTLEREQKGFFVAGCHTNMAALSEELGALDDALEHQITAMQMYRDLGARGDELECLLSIAKLTLPSDPAEALRMASENQQELLAQIGYESKRKLFHLLYQAYKVLGEESKALEMHESFVLYDDSLQTEKHSLAVLRAAYEKDVEHQIEEVQWAGEQERSLQEIKQLKTMFGLVLGFVVMIGLLIIYIVKIQRRHQDRRDELLSQILVLRSKKTKKMAFEFSGLELDFDLLNQSLGRTLNETDCKVLNILLENPSITNRGISEIAHLSVDGIGSSLRRMYEYFGIKETKYKKISLLHAAMKICERKNG